MNRALRSALLALALAAVVQGAAAQPLGDLLQKVSSAPDFRVRVQAALELGKTKSRASRIALETALDDENAAVRAAAAAGLKVMRDPGAIAALEKHEGDSSPAVRAQIKNSIETLRLADGPGKVEEKPDLVVQVGKMRSSGTASGGVLEDVARASKIRLRELPGVAVVDEGDEPTPARKHIPTVMVTGRVKQLEASRDGASMTYRASIEFVLHKMPGQTIKGVVTGSARASGAVSGEDSARSMADLRKSAIEAAVESAVRRAPQALRAAAQ